MDLLEAGSLAIPRSLPLTEYGTVAKGAFIPPNADPLEQRVSAVILNLVLGLDNNSGGVGGVHAQQLLLEVGYHVWMKGSETHVPASYIAQSGMHSQVSTKNNLLNCTHCFHGAWPNRIKKQDNPGLKCGKASLHPLSAPLAIYAAGCVSALSAPLAIYAAGCVPALSAPLAIYAAGCVSEHLVLGSRLGDILVVDADRGGSITLTEEAAWCVGMWPSSIELSLQSSKGAAARLQFAARAIDSWKQEEDECLWE
eukprot:scaffold14301_cov18-Tisochrysis_lutea.AAC.2